MMMVLKSSASHATFSGHGGFITDGTRKSVRFCQNNWDTRGSNGLRAPDFNQKEKFCCRSAADAASNPLNNLQL
jgi:hypothetical protein